MRRFLMAFGTSLLMIGLMSGSYAQGSLSRTALLQGISLVLLGGAIFFLLFRCGLNLRFANPSLTVPQMISATFVIEYVMYMANGGRAVFLVMLLMIFLFGLLQLTTRSLLLCAAVTLTGYGVVIGLLWRVRPDSLDLGAELLQWCALAIILLWFAVMGGFISGLRTKLHKKNTKLQGLLHRAQTSEATLIDAIESLNESFALFDANDRLVLCNREYARLFTERGCFEDIAGMHFEDLVRSSLEKGEVIEAAFQGDPEAWVAERIRRHRDPRHELFVLRTGDRRWLQVSEQHTRDGGIVGVRRDISAQKCIEQRLAMEYQISLLLTESATLAEALPKIIQSFCETLGWDCGVFWHWDKEAQLLRCSESWSSGSAPIEQFLTASRQHCLVPGSAGLTGHVWTTGEPCWIADLDLEPDCLRADVAAAAGLRTALAFPIGVGVEKRGMIEFFIDEVRPSDPALLTMASSIGIQIGQFIARKDSEEEIRQLAFHDPLTRLPNRRMLIDRLQHGLATSVPSRVHGALLLVDLDHFKTINDTLGHDKGDMLLQQVAQRLAACVRPGDTVARQGGDEFVIMLMDLSGEVREAAIQTETIGENILTALNLPYQLAGHTYHNSASIGATLFNGQLVATSELLKRVDLAMYRAKVAGRNTLRFYEADMQAAVTRLAALETDLRQGLKEAQFLLYYQAQVDGNGNVTGAEVLLRWHHPARGFTSPAEFIPVAEESGLILPIGRWVLETACHQLEAWAGDPAMAHLSVAVNVSARQFRHPDFLQQMVELLDRTGIDPRKLKLELTESMLVDNIEQTIVKMTALKCLGVSFSLDDFGTGYSSLSYLKRLPLSQLKIDQSFVQDLLTDPSDAAIVRTIVTLAQSLGLAVIAEGVETQAQCDFLAENGCSAYQGYWFSRPLQVTQFESLVRGDTVTCTTCLTDPVIKTLLLH